VFFLIGNFGGLDILTHGNRVTHMPFK